MKTSYKTHSCGELRAEHEGQEVSLAGWVHRRRDHGALIFVDLRDNDGIVQVVFNPKQAQEAYAAADQVRSEYVIQVKGKVVRRRPGTENRDLPTGGLRSRGLKFIRDFLTDKGFVEVETPILIKSTPEGARDYLVPSRVNPGCFSALPQDPHHVNSLRMVAG